MKESKGNYGPISKGAPDAPKAPKQDQTDMIKTLLELPGGKPRKRAYK